MRCILAMDKLFTCPDCGETFLFQYVASRQRCPDCAKKRTRLLNKINEEKRRERAKEKAEALRARKVCPGDAEMDRRREIQMKQCRNCEYLCKDGLYEFCDFLSWEGRLRDRGEGDGKCGSFLPKGTKTASERKARRRGLAWGETSAPTGWR